MVVGEALREHNARKPDLLIGIVNVLIADETEKFVFDQRTAQRSSRRVAMQFRDFVIRRNIRVCLVKKRRGVQPIRPRCK